MTATTRATHLISGRNGRMSRKSVTNWKSGCIQYKFSPVWMLPGGALVYIFYFVFFFGGAITDGRNQEENDDFASDPRAGTR